MKKAGQTNLTLKVQVYRYQWENITMGVAWATEKVIGRKKKSWSGCIILCWTNYMLLSEKSVLSGIGETVKTVFVPFSWTLVQDSTNLTPLVLKSQKCTEGQILP